MTRNIVITGTSRGLGRALSSKFANAGHRVAGCARAPSHRGSTSTGVGACRYDQVDLSDDDAVGHWARDLVQQWGVPDLVINNAAVINANQPLWEVPLEDFTRLLQVNIQGVFSVIRHLLPAMIDAGEGVIANMSSGWGRSVSADVASYCCSKWGVEGLTLALAEDLPAGLAAVSVNPGVINTDMLHSCFGSDAASAESPEQWARRAVPFFLGLSAAHNGRSLTV